MPVETQLILIGWAIHTILEYWLGKTDRTESGSVLEVVEKGLVALIGLILRREKRP